MTDRIECLIEGAKVVSVACVPDSETEYLRGFVREFTTDSIWTDETTTVETSFWQIVEDIMRHHNKFFDPKTGRDRSKYSIFFGYHVTDEPMTWHECEIARDMIALGVPSEMYAHDRYSDLTGYLWTDYKVRGGHNVEHMLNTIPYGKFVSLRFCIEPLISE